MRIFAYEFDQKPNQSFSDDKNHFGTFVYQSSWTISPMLQPYNIRE
jgi:hypothetical protein